MRLLIDTHILVWIVLNDKRLTEPQRSALGDSDNAIVVGPATAYELSHLQKLGRIPLTEPVGRLQELVGFESADLPFGIWQKVAGLPDFHRDPIDRLLIAHALLEGMTLVTADANIRRYPVTCV